MKPTIRYVIRSITPANGFSAVWSHAHGAGIQIEIRPLDFIAVADVQHYKQGKWIDAGSDVVGVELGEGFFQVVTDFVSCHGIVRDGASWSECLDLLPSELASRAVEPNAMYEPERNNLKGGAIMA